APTGPQQRRLRIAARRRFNQTFQVAQQRGINLRRLLPSTARSPHPPRERVVRRPLKFVQATPNGASREAGDAGYRRDTATSLHARLGRGEPPPTPFVKNRIKRRMAKRDGCLVDHAASL